MVFFSEYSKLCHVWLMLTKIRQEMLCMFSILRNDKVTKKERQNMLCKRIEDSIRNDTLQNVSYSFSSRFDAVAARVRKFFTHHNQKKKTSSLSSKMQRASSMQLNENAFVEEMFCCHWRRAGSSSWRCRCYCQRHHLLVTIYIFRKRLNCHVYQIENRSCILLIALCTTF